MSWATRFRVRQSTVGSLWLVPLLGGLVGAVLGAVDVSAEEALHLPASLSYSSSTASTLLSAVIGAMAALTGFVVTVTVLVVQMATSSFSARLLRLWYRDAQGGAGALCGNARLFLCPATPRREQLRPEPGGLDRRSARIGLAALVRRLPR
jgi:uncharacterized membrane protein